MGAEDKGWKKLKGWFPSTLRLLNNLDDIKINSDELKLNSLFMKNFLKHIKDNSRILRGDLGTLLGIERASRDFLHENRNLLQDIEPRQPDYNDVTLYPVCADLTATGVQYGTEVTTGAANTDVLLFEYTFNPPHGGDILWVYFLVGISFRAVSTATADMTWVAQARNMDGTWVDLFVAQTEEDVGAGAWVDFKKEGYFCKVANFNSIPMDFRILYQCNELNEGRARPKNNTIIRPVWEITI